MVKWALMHRIFNKWCCSPFGMMKNYQVLSFRVENMGGLILHQTIFTSLVIMIKPSLKVFCTNSVFSLVLKIIRNKLIKV